MTKGSVRTASPTDRTHFQRLWLASLVEERAAGSDMLPTGKSVQFGLDYFQSYTSGSRFGACLLWLPEGTTSPEGYTMLGERWEPDGFDREGGVADLWLWNVYVTPRYRSGTAGLALLDAATDWCLSEGYERVSFNIPTGMRSDALARRWGARPRGVWYTADLKSPRGTARERA